MNKHYYYIQINDRLIGGWDQVGVAIAQRSLFPKPEQYHIYQAPCPTLHDKKLDEASYTDIERCYV